mmetsp:Transcript_7635/g.21727  ORF Transcript_7635/g.21727 Transcript_7635/m.21727 type:complete len:90 (+) Transcript_7635:558-827(+)
MQAWTDLGAHTQPAAVASSPSRSPSSYRDDALSLWRAAGASCSFSSPSYPRKREATQPRTTPDSQSPSNSPSTWPASSNVEPNPSAPGS